MMWTGISKHFRSRVRGWAGILRADPNGLRTLQGGVLRATANKTSSSARLVNSPRTVRAAFLQRHSAIPLSTTGDRYDTKGGGEEFLGAVANISGIFDGEHDLHVQQSAALRNDDGHKIVCKSWRSQAYTEPRALVFLAHGFGEHCHGDTYHTVARDLTRVGCYVFAHDHVGHGKSEGPRATIKSFDTYVDDILTHVDMRRTDFPGKPIYLFGHSMGGLLCVLTVQRKPKDFAGMVLLGPLLGIHKQEATWFKRTMAGLLGSVIPNFPLGKLSLEKVSSDPAVVKRLAEDPLRYHGSVTAAWGAAALSALENMQANVEAVKLPFLIEHGSADKLCDPADSHQFYEKAASEDKTLKIIAGAYHCLLTEPGGVNRQVRKDIVNWISGRLPKK